MIKYPHKTEEDAIKAAEAEARNKVYVEFEGHNCEYFNPDADCSGWDGESRRCECGNRRVLWETAGSDEMGWIAFAVAY